MKQIYFNPQMPATRLNAFQAVCVMIMTALTSLAEACRLPVNTYFGHGGHACRHGSGNSRCRARNGTRRHGLWRILLIATLALTAAAPATAQEGLNVNNVFLRFGHAKGCKMVEMHNAKLKGYNLKVYKSLTYKNIGASIEPYLKADRKNAKKIREVVENGQIVSGYYMMPPKGNGINRYILFSKVKPNRGTVIYIEGALSPDDIMKLCYT